MESGLADHIWMPNDMLSAADQFITNRAKPTDVVALTNSVELEKRYWVVHRPYHQKAMIQKADYSNCLGGRGRMNGETKRTFWSGFARLEEAIAHAASYGPEKHKQCKKCLGQDYTLHRYGRRL